MVVCNDGQVLGQGLPAEPVLGAAAATDELR